MSSPITEQKNYPSRRPLRQCRRAASAFKKPPPPSLLRTAETMNKKVKVAELNIDVIRHIMLFVAQSPDGAYSFARALSVCKSFRELEKDVELLKCVAFGKRIFKEYHQSFWGLNGLLTRCAFAENNDARIILRKYLEGKVDVWSGKKFVVEKSAKVARKMHTASMAKYTRGRKIAAELAMKEFKEMFPVVQKEGRELLDHARALGEGIPNAV